MKSKIDIKARKRIEDILEGVEVLKASDRPTPSPQLIEDLLWLCSMALYASTYRDTLVEIATKQYTPTQWAFQQLQSLAKNALMGI